MKSRFVHMVQTKFSLQNLNHSNRAGIIWQFIWTRLKGRLMIPDFRNNSPNMRGIFGDQDNASYGAPAQITWQKHSLRSGLLDCMVSILPCTTTSTISYTVCRLYRVTIMGNKKLHDHCCFCSVHLCYSSWSLHELCGAESASG